MLDLAAAVARLEAQRRAHAARCPRPRGGRQQRLRRPGRSAARLHALRPTAATSCGERPVLAGSAEHFYRLSIGAFPYVTAVFPLSVPANQETQVELIGFNLPAESEGARSRPARRAKSRVPLDIPQARSRREAEGARRRAAGECWRRSPTTQPQQATRAGGARHGRTAGWISAAGGQPMPTCSASRARPARRGSSRPTPRGAARRSTRGSKSSTPRGKPVERLLLQAVRDSYITFRADRLARRIDARVKNWEEMELNEYLYMQGEVVQAVPHAAGPGLRLPVLRQRRQAALLLRHQRHDARRWTSRATSSSRTPPGAKLVPNGLPVFPLYYANDDDGERKLGSDSR